ncbi:Monocarboxylate transporter 14 [Schistosoma japonicum]|nr:Monocarboxylate transporter 14 [Schistosoma japonicum]
MSNLQKLLLIFGGFVSYMLADGYTYSIGVLYSELMNAFHLSSVETAILPGMIFSMPQFFAPFLCPLLETYGFSSGSAWGALLMWTGCFAVGLTMCGSGVGAFASNYLLAWLLNSWSWREVLFIESAILLNILVTASCSHHLDAELNTQLLIKRQSFYSDDIEDKNCPIQCNSEKHHTSGCTVKKYFWNSIRFCLCFPSLFRFRTYQLLPSHSNNLSISIEYNDQDATNNHRVVSLNNSNKLLSCACPQFMHSFGSNYKKLFSPKLWKNPNFLFYVIANGITGAGVVIPWTFIYDYVLTTLSHLEDQNLINSVSTKDISWLPSLIGFGLLFGKSKIDH